jgi:hypothetical protein
LILQLLRMQETSIRPTRAVAEDSLDWVEAEDAARPRAMRLAKIGLDLDMIDAPYENARGTAPDAQDLEKLPRSGKSAVLVKILGPGVQKKEKGAGGNFQSGEIGGSDKVERGADQSLGEGML